MEKLNQNAAFQKANASPMKVLLQPPGAGSMVKLIFESIYRCVLPGIMVALFWYNDTEWIGDKQCYVAEGVASTLSSAVASEVDVAAAWKQWSLFGMIFWGLLIVAQII